MNEMRRKCFHVSVYSCTQFFQSKSSQISITLILDIMNAIKIVRYLQFSYFLLLI